jgi:rod shape-determining protein MreC
MLRFLQSYWRTGALILVVAGVLFLALGGYLNPLVRFFTSPIVGAQGWLFTRFQAVYEAVRSPQDMANLRQQNALLESENARLQSQIIQLQQQLKDTDVLYALLKYARSRPNDAYIAAAVVGRDPSPFLRYVIIDKGSDDGILKGMPVVTAQGLAGRVDAVISNAARVQLINDPGSAINVKMSATGTEGILTGSITGEIQLEMIPLDITLQSGDVVLTSSLGGAYPSGVLVGQVSSVRRIETELFQTALVQPAVDFDSLSAVLVVTNFSPVDITPLIPSEGVP